MKAMAGSEANARAAVRDSGMDRREIFLRLISEYQGELRRLAAVYVNDSRGSQREDVAVSHRAQHGNYGVGEAEAERAGGIGGGRTT